MENTLRRLIILFIFLAVFSYAYSQEYNSELLDDFRAHLKGGDSDEETRTGEGMWTNDGFPLKYGSRGKRVAKLWSYMVDTFGVDAGNSGNPELYSYLLEEYVRENLNKNQITEQEYKNLGISRYEPYQFS